MADKIPQLGSSVKGVSEVYDMIKNPEYVRPTTRMANIKRAIDRGTPSTVVRSAGYNRLFQTFLKHGISSATVNKFKLIPDIANFDSAKAYSEALKKFRNTAFKGLSNAQLRVIESSGFLSQYAKDQRIKLLKSGMENVKPNLNKIMDQLFDFTFMTEKSAAGVKKPKLQSKIYTKIRDMAKSTLNKAQRLNLDYALSQVDDLFKAGNVKKATKFLAGISTMVAKGAFARVPGLDLLITKEMGSGELTPEMIEEFKKDQAQDRMNKRGGGIMDINHMTRPVGYDNGGEVEEDQLPYDPDKGYTENLNELMTDIGGTLKEKIFGAGKSLRDKINDFLKYGHGDPENQWKGNPYELNEFEFNLLHPRVDFESTLPEERTIDTEGEEYRRLNELLDQLGGRGFHRGGIVSINRMTRTL